MLSAWKEFLFQDLSSKSVDAKYLLPTVITLHSRGVLAENEPHWYKMQSCEAASSEQDMQSVIKFSKVFFSIFFFFWSFDLTRLNFFL